jgi:hypothetical protein
MLERHIRGERKALLANLRAFPPRGTANEVWNHGVGKYTATFHAIPGKGPRAVRLDVALEGNAGSSLNGQDEKPRVCSYSYSLVYGLDGLVDQSNPYACDWISVGGEAMFCPLNLLEVVNTRWAGHNPYITEQNVRQIDAANGGGSTRLLASVPRPFRSVFDYEGAGGSYVANNSRPPYFSGGTPDIANGSPSMPRRGLFRGLFGR